MYGYHGPAPLFSPHLRHRGDIPMPLATPSSAQARQNMGLTPEQINEARHIHELFPTPAAYHRFFEKHLHGPY
jgi:hypothetical protein